MSTDVELTIEQRVAAGAAYLDEHKPGWIDEIELAALDLANTCLCVLGQVYGNYWTSEPVLAYAAGVDAEPGQNVIAALGFNARWRENPRDELPELRELNVAWLRLIESRRAEVE